MSWSTINSTNMHAPHWQWSSVAEWRKLTKWNNTSWTHRIPLLPYTYRILTWGSIYRTPSSRTPTVFSHLGIDIDRDVARLREQSQRAAVLQADQLVLVIQWFRKKLARNFRVPQLPQYAHYPIDRNVISIGSPKNKYPIMPSPRYRTCFRSHPGLQ